MPRCADCNKFVSLDYEQEPEVELEFDFDAGRVTGSVQICNCCGECGSELTRADFDVDAELDAETLAQIQDHVAAHYEKALAAGGDDSECGCDWSVELEGERTTRSEGKGRGARTFYGVCGEFVLTCDECGETINATWEGDEIQASHMESY